MVERFKTLKFPDIDIKLSHKLIEEKMKYTFHEPNILAVALTHKSKAKHKNGSIWDDYNLMEFLGDSVIKFFNCKRIISNRKEFVKNKEKNFTDIQRLKFIRTASEKNILFSLICMKSGIYKYIRHETKNEDLIESYKVYIDSIDNDDVDFEVLNAYHIKMLADVIEAIIGAILVDSCSIKETEDAWKTLFEEYLIRYADNPKTPPKRAFIKYCEKKPFLVNVKDAKQVVETLSKDNLFNSYGVEEQSSVMKYELVYKDIVIFRRFYANSVRSKDKQFYIDLKLDLKKILVPYYKKSIEYNSQFFRMTEMNKYDTNGVKRAERDKCNLPGSKVVIQRINSRSVKPEVESEYIAKVKKEWDDTTPEIFDEWLIEFFMASKFAQLLINDISKIIQQI